MQLHQVKACIDTEGRLGKTLVWKIYVSNFLLLFIPALIAIIYLLIDQSPKYIYLLNTPSVSDHSWAGWLILQLFANSSSHRLVQHQRHSH